MNDQFRQMPMLVGGLVLVTVGYAVIMMFV